MVSDDIGNVRVWLHRMARVEMEYRDSLEMETRKIPHAE
jgi:hypothetical protein